MSAPNASTIIAAQRLLAALDGLESAVARLGEAKPLSPSDSLIAQRHETLQRESRAVLSDIDALLSQLREP